MTSTYPGRVAAVTGASVTTTGAVAAAAGALPLWLINSQLRCPGVLVNVRGRSRDVSYVGVPSDLVKIRSFNACLMTAELRPKKNI